jgi:hypothetical protein
MKITFEGFAGEIPRLNPAYLPPQNGAAVSNAKLTNGDLAPMRGDRQAHTLGSAAQRIYLYGSTWLSWTHDADAAPGPVAQDRLYITRGASGVPQMRYSGATYNLALPAPNEKPSATASNITQSDTIATNGAARIFTSSGTTWTAANTTVNVTQHSTYADLSAGTVNLARPQTAQRQLVATLPALPANRTCLAVVNEGTGTVLIHRNGKAVADYTADIPLAGNGTRMVLIYDATLWRASQIAPPGIFLNPDQAVTTPFAYQATAGQNISANGDRAITVTLPAHAGLAVGTTVSVARVGTGTVNVSPAAGGTFTSGANPFPFGAQADRFVFVWTGAGWTPLKIGGAFDDNYLSTAGDSALVATKTRRFLTTQAPETITLGMPAGGVAGDVLEVGVVGDIRAVLLPRGVLVNGESQIVTLQPSGAFVRFEFDSGSWMQTLSSYRATTRDTTASSGETLIVLTEEVEISIGLPTSATQPVKVKRIGAKPVIVFGLDGGLTTETVLFAYTYVTSLGEESQPSLASDPVNLVGAQNPTITMAAAVPTGRMITHKRVYRSITTSSGATEFFFVDQVASNVTVYIHDAVAKPPQEVLSTTDFDPPAAGLTGITAMPNGMMVAFEGRKLYFCEPYQPHAWPEKYSLTVPDQIVGLAAFGTSVAVLTTAMPYVAQGLHPDNMTLTRIEVSLPCLSKAGIADMGFAAVYPSTEGLVRISQNGAEVISSQLWDVEQWRALSPATFRAAPSRGRYAFSYQPGGTGARKLAYVDLSGQQPFLVPVTNTGYLSLISHVETGRLFALLSNGTTIVSVDDEIEAPGTYAWKSKPTRLPGPTNMGCIMVDAKATPGATPSLNFKVWADGVLVRETTGAAAYGRIERLPARLATEWQVEVTGNATVTRIVLAGVPDEVWQT